MMKKNIFKISLGIILLFTFVINVKADLVCEGGDAHKIVETSMADPAGFNTWGHICEWVFTGRYSKVANDKGETEFPTSTDEEYEYVLKLGDELIWVAQTQYADDFKSSTTSMVQVPRCGDSKRYYSAKFTCKKYASKIDGTYTGCSDCTLNCAASEKTYSCGDYYCPEGYVDSGGNSNGDCVKTDTFEKDDKDRKTPYRAEEGCGDEYAEKDVVNTLNCPIYQCNLTTQLIGACTPSFKVEGEPAYCVNPSQPFTQEKGSDGFAKHDAKFKEDVTFDVNECLNSYSTMDCGYANILMESKYHNDHGNAVASKSTELAMRLWGVEGSTAGFQYSFGISLRYGSTADNQASCDQRTLFLFQGIDENVYYVTRNYIFENLLIYVTNKYKENDYIDPISFRKDDEFGKHFVIDCSKIGQKVGLVCGGGNKSKIYRTGFGLYFNTTRGNSLFREHMREVFGITVNAPKGIELEETEDGVGIVVDYGNFELTGIKKDKEYDCDEIESSSEYTEEEKRAILPYCKTKIVYYDFEGNRSETVPDICKGKNSLWCTSKPVKLAVCSEEEYSKTVTVKYPGSRDSYPAKLINCGSVDNQVLYAIIEDDEGSSDIGDPDTYKEIPFTLKIYSCKGNCNANEFRTNSASCAYNKDKPDGNVSTGYVKDPSLSCILNADTDAAKTMYDYSEEFGVNSNFCKVYCSDEVEYYIPDKVTVKSGLAFKYDIAVKSYLNKTDNHLMSNVVKSRRNCVSEIRYNKTFTGALNYEKMYGLDTEKDITSVLGGRYISNWKDLYTVLKAKSNKERGRKENLNEIIYDLYNCNFFSQGRFDDNNVTKPKQKVFETNSNIDNTYANVKKIYGASNSYGFDSCTINSSTNDCITMSKIEYSGGSEITSSTYVGKDSPISTKSVTSSNISEVKYCSGSTCYKYPDDVEANSVEDLATYDYSKFMGNTQGKTQDGYYIPTNDYAMFSISTEVGFYSTSRFQTIQSTGYVKPGINDSSLITLEEYSYPTSKNAYGICKYTNRANTNTFSGRIDGSSDKGPTTNSSCVVTHRYGEVHTYKYRHDNNKFSDKLLSSEFRNPSCYIDVESSQPQCDAGSKNCKNGLIDITEYRNVDRSNIFPNGTSGTSNWDTSSAIIIKEEIEAAGNYIYTDENQVQYSFTITPDQIKAIRNYNNNSNTYVNIELTDCQIKDGMYFNCRSKFVESIRNGTTDTSETYATINDNKDGSSLFGE